VERTNDLARCDSFYCNNGGFIYYCECELDDVGSCNGRELFCYDGSYTNLGVD